MTLDVERREEAWKELCSNKNAPVYVACDGQRVIGFCHISASRDRDSEGTAEINSIYMDPAELRRGYGRELLSGVISFALQQGFRDVTLWGLIENKVAREFYEAMGFMPDGATKTEYGSGFQCNEIRYRRDLTNGKYNGALTTMNFRKSKPADVACVLEILYENSKWLDSLGIFQWPFAWMNAQELEFIKEIEVGNFHVYSESGLIVGVLHLTSEPNPLWGEMPGYAFYISKIAVKRSAAGRGIGSRMIAKIEEFCWESGCSRIRLDCVSGNNKLKSYYEQRGFQFVGSRTLPDVSLDLFEKRP